MNSAGVLAVTASTSATDKDTVAAQGATAPEASATPDVVSAAPPPSKPLSVIERIRLARANLGVE